MGLKEKFTASPYWDGRAASAAQRRRARIILASVLVVALLTAGLLAWAPWRGPEQGSAQPAGAGVETPAPSGAPAPAATSTTAPAAPTCPDPDLGTERNPLSAALTARWELKTTAYVPVDPRVGPCAFSPAGAPTRFAHTSDGALFAAQWYAGALDVGGVVPRWKERITTSVKAGPGRDLMLAAAQRVSDGLVPVPPTRDTRIQTCGYRFAAYGPEAARIELVVCPKDGWISPVTTLGISLVWEGDWKVVATLDGKLATAQPSSDFTGVTPWGPPGFAGTFQ